MKWMRGLFAAAQGEGLNAGSAGTTGAAGFRVNVSIQVNNHPDTSTTTDDPQLKFVVHNAWITSVSYSDLDATNGALLFETMTLIHEGLSVGFTGSNGIATDSTQTTVLI
jgi:cobalamin biosynthesis protein CbiD